MTVAPGGVEETQHSGADPLPAEAQRGHEDGPLDSLGKAIAAPIEGAAEDEEPKADPKKPPMPPA